METATGQANAKRKPVFVKVEDLKPGTTGHTLIVKVVETTPVNTSSRPNRSRALLSRPAPPARIAECVVGDETGTIIFTARNEQGIPFFPLININTLLLISEMILEQIDLMTKGATVILRNAKIVMFKGTTMRLAVDKWGRIEVTEPAKFEVKEDNNLSLVEYELVTVPDQGYELGADLMSE
ncbi:Nuclear fusion defective 6 isoform 1 [Hibiscus syriacus]|uniref:Nuclear fusion defective 6 isoform 1 n=1 Tax=Hibiscus syriacus TaxID=106335 RepID=A0A6A2ZNQ9_HIBSY|nr:Nuclear fusion defective 6 isoform 1 [Hibiscus syriacus]